MEPESISSKASKIQNLTEHSMATLLSKLVQFILMLPFLIVKSIPNSSIIMHIRVEQYSLTMKLIMLQLMVILKVMKLKELEEP